MIMMMIGRAVFFFNLLYAKFLCTFKTEGMLQEQTLPQKITIARHLIWQILNQIKNNFTFLSSV